MLVKLSYTIIYILFSALKNAKGNKLFCTLFSNGEQAGKQARNCLLPLENAYFLTFCYVFVTVCNFFKFLQKTCFFLS